MSGTSATTGGDPASGGSPAASAGVSTHGHLIDDVLFNRELDEVYLLLDFVSGRTDKDLSKLTVPDPSAPPDAGKDLSPREVMARLALIRYPPEPKPTRKSEDAAFLMLARDRLIGLASPARGITIAFTTLFAGMRWLPEWLLKLLRKARIMSPASVEPRSTLAESAFPDLTVQALKLKVLLAYVLIFVAVWLAWTAFAYWDVALGRSIVQQIDHIHDERNALYQANPEFALKLAPDKGATTSSVTRSVTSASGGPAGSPGGTSMSVSETDTFTYSPPKICSEVTAQVAMGCSKFRDLDTAEYQAMKNLRAFRDCNGPGCTYSHVVRWAFVLCGVIDGTMSDEQSIVSILSVFSNFILPMMFGVLGTCMNAIRTIQWKVRESTLSPRDYWDTVFALPLGIVAGVAVGLFYSPTTATTVAGGSGLATNLSLTTCGLGFLAGYGAKAFFDALDSMLKSAFSVNGDSEKPKPVK